MFDPYNDISFATVSDFQINCNTKTDCDQENMFLCKTSGKCILKDFVCDGSADCDDASDEQNCDGWYYFFSIIFVLIFMMFKLLC